MTYSIAFDRLQLQRGHRTLFAEPLSGCFSSGALNLLTGPNGSGKTSLLDVMSFRAPAPHGATIRWSGCSKATDVAYLPQQLWDVQDIRIADLLSLALPKHSAVTDVPETLRGLLANPKRELAALSGGQRQLLLFWLVSSQPRRIYVYDEPVRYLDPVAARYVVDTIENQVSQAALVVVTDHSQEKQWSVACRRLKLEKPAANGR